MHPIYGIRNLPNCIQIRILEPRYFLWQWCMSQLQQLKPRIESLFPSPATYRLVWAPEPALEIRGLSKNDTCLVVLMFL